MLVAVVVEIGFLVWDIIQKIVDATINLRRRGRGKGK
jgi:hypothetical protein